MNYLPVVLDNSIQHKQPRMDEYRLIRTLADLFRWYRKEMLQIYDRRLMDRYDRMAWSKLRELYRRKDPETLRYYQFMEIGSRNWNQDYLESLVTDHMFREPFQWKGREYSIIICSKMNCRESEAAHNPREIVEDSDQKVTPCPRCMFLLDLGEEQEDD